MSETLMSKRARRVRWTPEERAEWLELYRASGQTVAAFCRANEIAYASLSLWLRQSEPAPSSDGGEWVEVQMDGLRCTAETAVKVHLPGGAGLEIVPGTDPLWLAQLVRALTPVSA
jgi:transposase-like protein